jgi:dTDP-4-dehydrorhamnose reductase
MKILITGAKGQLGKKLIETLSDHELVLTDSDDMDITDKDKVVEVLGREKPNFIIHAAAYTAVDKAEEMKELCYKVNALGTKNLAEVSQAQHTTMLYISTDYVFDGLGHTPLKESDPTSPVNYYGQTKRDGEKFIEAICEQYYILRTSWLYGELPASHPGSNFVETMLKLAATNPEVKVVSDQIGSPTYTKDLCAVISEIISRLCQPDSNVRHPEPAEGSLSLSENPTSIGDSSLPQNDKPIPYGIYHVTGEGETSWYDFAKEIFSQTNTQVTLTPITTAEFPRPAKRPAYSYLSKDKLKSAGFTIRPWQEALAEYLACRTAKQLDS